MLMTFTTGSGFAQSPHFLSAKEAGLGNNALISYTASADATATYACINGGGNHPKATNKETVSGLVSASGTFSSVCAKKR